MNDIREKLEAEFPVEFLATYGAQLFPVVAVLAGMAARGETENIYHAAHLFRLLVGSSMAMASEVEKKAAAEWRPRWVM